MSSVLLPIVNLCNQNYILCEVRSDLVEQPGEICLPGGHRNEGESIEETALRETMEELAIPAEYIQLTGESFAREMNDGRVVNAVIAVLDRQALASIRRQESEVAGWFLLPINWLRNHPAEEYDYSKRDLMPEKLKSYLEGYSFSLEGKTLCWDYEGRIVWGLTAGIINQFLSEYR